jgi:hypothetical protein
VDLDILDLEIADLDVAHQLQVRHRGTDRADRDLQILRVADRETDLRMATTLEPNCCYPKDESETPEQLRVGSLHTRQKIPWRW